MLEKRIPSVAVAGPHKPTRYGQKVAATFATDEAKLAGTIFGPGANQWTIK